MKSSSQTGSLRAYGSRHGPYFASAWSPRWTSSMAMISHATRQRLQRALSLALFIAAFGGSVSCWAQPTSFPNRYDDGIRASVRHYWPDLPFWRLWKAQLYQESRLDPSVCSGAGACGLAQFMDPTFEQITRELGDAGASRFDARVSIDAGAYYMAKLRRTWAGRDRQVLDSHDLGAASYNAGVGSILRAQESCMDARLWADVAPCLERTTNAAHAKETISYVAAIHRIWKQLEGAP